jgi:hypothetical protein
MISTNVKSPTSRKQTREMGHPVGIFGIVTLFGYGRRSASPGIVFIKSL